MSASGVTQNFQLPIYNPDYITSWLTDFNGAMNLIDAAMNAIKTTPELTEEWVKGNTEYDSVEKYKEGVRKELEETNRQMA